MIQSTWPMHMVQIIQFHVFWAKVANCRVPFGMLTEKGINASRDIIDVEQEVVRNASDWHIGPTRSWKIMSNIFYMYICDKKIKIFKKICKHCFQICRLWYIVRNPITIQEHIEWNGILRKQLKLLRCISVSNCSFKQCIYVWITFEPVTATDQYYGKREENWTGVTRVDLNLSLWFFSLLVPHALL